MKKRLLLLTSLLLLVAFAGGGIVARAYTSEGAKYRHFTGITAVCAVGDGFAVADESGLAFFDADGNALMSGGEAVPIVTEAALSASLAFRDGKVYALANGSVYSIDPFTGDAVEIISGTADASFIAAGEYLYVAKGDTIGLYGYDGAAVSTVIAVGEVRGLTVFGGGAVYSVKRGAYCDVYDLDGKLYESGLRSDGALTGGDELYCILRNGALALVTERGPEEISEGGFVAAASAGGDGSVVYATDAGEIFMWSDGENRLVLASDSSAEGFYSHPSTAAARFGRLVVADTYNDRLALTTADGVSYIDVPRPRAAVILNDGTIAAAHSRGAVSVLAGDGSEIARYDLGGYITALVADNMGRLYALNGGALVRADDGETVAAGLSAVAVTYGGDGFIAANGGRVFDPVSGTDLFTCEYDVLSLVPDASGNIFMAVRRESDGAVVRRSPDGTVTVLKGGLGSGELAVNISRTTVGGFAAGDLIVTDEIASKVSALSGADCGVSLLPSALPEVRPYDNDMIVRPTRCACSIYETPDENAELILLNANTDLIVAKYDIAENPNFSFVAYDDPAADRLYYGYVFRSNLAEPRVQKDPPAENGVVYYSADIYELPSLRADKIAGLAKNSIVALLPFADYGKDDTDWYRVETETGMRGFVPAASVSVRDFVPGGARPQYNAVIRSVNGSVSAHTYRADGSVIEGVDLLVGTRVEVVGAFDTSEKFTRVRHFDPKLGTLECYVETIYIDYNNISVVQIVAIVIAILTFILLVLLLVRLYVRHRRI